MSTEENEFGSAAGSGRQDGSEAERLLGIECVCAIVVDGSRIEYDLAEVELRQYIDRHHLLRLSIRERAEDTTRDIASYADTLGKSISMTIEPSGGVVAADRSLTFVGVVTKISQANNIDSINVTTIEAHSPTIAMDGAKQNAFFRDQSRSDIIGAIVRDYPITTGNIESAGSDLAFCVQHRETDYDFVMRLASAASLFAHYDGQEFKAIKPNSSGAEELVWRETLGSFEMGLGTGPQDFTAQVYNYEQSKSYSQDTSSTPATSSLSSLTKKSPEASKDIYTKSGYSTAPKVVADTRSLDDVLARNKSQAMGRMITCHGQSSVPAITVGKCISITGLDQCDGHYLLDSIVHTVTPTGGYQNTFVCRPLDIAAPVPRATASPQTLIQSAVVVDNNDPEGLGRVKVKFPWLEGEETPFLRVMTPHAGNERGWYVIPEIEDEVLVGYEFGSPDHPVVLGTVYNKDGAPPSDVVNAENDIKQFRTRAGNQIKITDTGGSEEIAITNSDGDNKLVLAVSGPSITIESTGDITIKGANVTIEADQELTMTSGSNATLEAGASLTTKASATLDAEGAMVNVKGNPINLN